MPGLPEPFRRFTTPLDLALALALAVAASLETQANDPQPGLRTVLAALVVLPVAARRRVPAFSASLIAVGLATEAFATESPEETGILLAVVVSAFSVAAYADRREALSGLGLLGMAVSAAIAVDPSDDASNILPTLALFIVIPAALGFTFRRRGHDLALLSLRAESAEQEAEAAVEAERRRIARELHDVVSHAVTLIAVQAEAGQALLDSDPAAARQSLAAISAASRDAVAELHSLLALLHEPADATSTAGLARMAALVEGARAAGMRVTVDESGVPDSIPPAVDHCAYRIVQEGLTNALRHARTPRVMVSIRRAPSSLELQVQSTGAAHQSTYGGSGAGLRGLDDRTRSLGGTLETAQHGDTYTLRARIPWGES